MAWAVLFALLPLLAACAADVTLPLEFEVQVVPKTDPTNPYYGLGEPFAFAMRPLGFGPFMEAAELTLYRNQQYVFHMVNVPFFHPFHITTSAIGADPTSIWTKGVQVPGAAPYTAFATNNDTLIFTPPVDAPALLYYQCLYHQYMGYKIVVLDSPTASPIFGSSTDSVNIPSSTNPPDAGPPVGSSSSQGVPLFLSSSSTEAPSTTTTTTTTTGAQTTTATSTASTPIPIFLSSSSAEPVPSTAKSTITRGLPATTTTTATTATAVARTTSGMSPSTTQGAPVSGPPMCGYSMADKFTTTFPLYVLNGTLVDCQNSCCADRLCAGFARDKLAMDYQVSSCFFKTKLDGQDAYTISGGEYVTFFKHSRLTISATLYMDFGSVIGGAKVNLYTWDADSDKLLLLSSAYTDDAGQVNFFVYSAWNIYYLDLEGVPAGATVRVGGDTSLAVIVQSGIESSNPDTPCDKTTCQCDPASQVTEYTLDDIGCIKCKCTASSATSEMPTSAPLSTESSSPAMSTSAEFLTTPPGTCQNMSCYCSPNARDYEWVDVNGCHRCACLFPCGPPRTCHCDPERGFPVMETDDYGCPVCSCWPLAWLATGSTSEAPSTMFESTTTTAAPMSTTTAVATPPPPPPPAIELPEYHCESSSLYLRTNASAPPVLLEIPCSCSPLFNCLVCVMATNDAGSTLVGGECLVCRDFRSLYQGSCVSECPFGTYASTSAEYGSLCLPFPTTTTSTTTAITSTTSTSALISNETTTTTEFFNGTTTTSAENNQTTTTFASTTTTAQSSSTSPTTSASPLPTSQPNNFVTAVALLTPQSGNVSGSGLAAFQISSANSLHHSGLFLEDAIVVEPTEVIFSLALVDTNASIVSVSFILDNATLFSVSASSSSEALAGFWTFVSLEVQTALLDGRVFMLVQTSDGAFGSNITVSGAGVVFLLGASPSDGQGVGYVTLSNDNVLNYTVLVTGMPGTVESATLSADGISFANLSVHAKSNGEAEISGTHSFAEQPIQLIDLVTNKVDMNVYSANNGTLTGLLIGLTEPGGGSGSGSGETTLPTSTSTSTRSTTTSVTTSAEGTSTLSTEPTTTSAVLATTTSVRFGTTETFVVSTTSSTAAHDVNESSTVTTTLPAIVTTATSQASSSTTTIASGLLGDPVTVPSTGRLTSASTSTSTATTTTTTTTTTTPTTTTTTTPPVTLSCAQQPTDIAFIIDSAASEDESSFTHALNVVAAVIRLLDISPNASRVSILTMADTVPLVLHNFALSDSRDTIISALESSSAYQAEVTDLKVALNQAQMDLFASGNMAYRHGRSAALVLTAGMASQPAVEIAAAAAMLASQGVHIMALGSMVRGDVGVRALNALVSSPDDVFVTSLESENNDATLSQAIATALVCNPPTTTTPAAPVVCTVGSAPACTCGAGCAICSISPLSSKCLSCDVSHYNNYGVCVSACPAGYSAANTSAGHACTFSTPSLDVAVLLDSSGSVSPTLFARMKQFVSSVVTLLPIGPNDVRISLMTYSNMQKNVLTFADTMDKTSVQQQIANIPYLSGGTDTVGALDAASLQLFGRTSAGFRGLNGVAIILTDGISDESVSEVHEAAVALQKLVRKVITIGVGPDISASDLAAIATGAGDVYMGNADGFGTLTPDQLVGALGAIGAQDTTPGPGNAQQQVTTTASPVPGSNGGGSAGSSSDTNIVPIILAVVIGVLVVVLVVVVVFHRRMARNKRTNTRKNHYIPPPLQPTQHDSDLAWDLARHTMTLSSTKTNQWDEPAAVATPAATVHFDDDAHSDADSSTAI